MSFNDEEIVVTIDAKRLIAIGLLAILTVATLSSYIIALFAWQADWNTDPLLKVMNLETQTSGGSPETTFSAGDTVKVEATIEKASAYSNPSYTVLTQSTTARIFIVVYYDPGTGVRPLHYYTTTRDLDPGEPELVETQFKLSSSAASGTNKYYVHCLVWDSYLPNGDTLTDWTESQQEVTFSVS
jgi:hypothetical protein